VAVSTPTRRYHVPSAIRRSSRRIDVEEARRLVAEGALLVDVRRNDIVDLPLERAARIPPDEIPARLEELPRDSPIVLACT
jgi:rhodanese-related sulfurtransferase